MQWQWDLSKSYTLVMDRREDVGYDVRHWFAGENLFVIFPNLNRRVDPLQPQTGNKHRLLADKRFRRALSLALDRQAIIDADYNGMGVPAQVAPNRVRPSTIQTSTRASSTTIPTGLGDCWTISV